MTILQKLTAIWKDDHLLRRVVKNSSYLVGSNVISAGLVFIQGIAAVRLIGVANWGSIGVIQTFTSNVNRFLSFRMSEVVVKHLGPDLAEGKKQEAAALVKAAGLTEAVTSVAAFTVLALLAHWAAGYFGVDTSMIPWFLFYGLTLLGYLVYETSTGVLQATHRFDQLARTNLIQCIITAATIFVVFLLNHWYSEKFAPYLVQAVLFAYVLGKTYQGISLAILAAGELHTALGTGWWRTSLRFLPDKRAKAWFALNTNLHGTMNLAFRDNILLYIAHLLSPLQAGYYKLALAFVSYISLILDPFISSTYTELTRTVAARQWDTTLRLLKRITTISSGAVLAMGGILTLTGWWFIPFLYKTDARPVYPLLLILLVGYGCTNIFQWNRSLLLSLGRSGFPVLVACLTGVVELMLIFTLVPRYGYLMMGAIFSGYLVVSIGINIWRGLYEVHRQQRAAVTDQNTLSAPGTGNGS